ncbi:MAG: CNNM domain-containing protein [Elusimicrobia bacterium]|nr:CNNM domain-containing protein [Elusimicrobiota bacterium]
MALIIIVLMLVVNALFAAYEMALASVSKTKLSVLAAAKRKGAKSALFMKEHIEGGLAVVQIVITLAGAVAAAVGGAGADEQMSPLLREWFSLSKRTADALSVIIVVLPLSFITIIFAELTPKTFAIKNNEFVVLMFSPAIRVLYLLLSPVVNIMEAIVRLLTRKGIKNSEEGEASRTAAMEDLRVAASVAAASRLFGKTEEKIVLSSAMFCSRKIGEIQIPLSQVYTLYADDDIAETFVKAHLDMHTRFPVCESKDNPQSIIGYLNFKDIFMATKASSRNKAAARSILRPILKLPAESTISQSMEKLIKARQHIALVCSGGTITGIVTLEDIFEEMVGDIEDEYDFFPVYVRRFGNALVASSSSKMSDIFSKLGKPPPANLPGEITLEKWAELKTGKAVIGGDRIKSDGLLVEPRKFRRKRVMEFLVAKS